MQVILQFTFFGNSPIQLQKLSDVDYHRIPMLKQVRLLAELAEREGTIKLTAKGYLPVRVVTAIRDAGFLIDTCGSADRIDVNKESDSLTITLTRILMELSGWPERARVSGAFPKKPKNSR